MRQPHPEPTARYALCCALGRVVKCPAYRLILVVATILPSLCQPGGQCMLAKSYLFWPDQSPLATAAHLGRTLHSHRGSAPLAFF